MGRLREVRDRTLAIEVAGRTGSVFLSGARVQVDLQMTDLPNTIATRGVVHQQSVGRGRRLYEVVLGESEDFVPFVVKSTIERRDAVRIATAETMTVGIKPSGFESGTFPELLAPVTDISTNGMGIKLAFPHDRSVLIGDTIELMVVLPGDDSPTRLVARAFHSRVVGLEVFVGLGFIDAPTARRVVDQSDPFAARRAVAGYVRRLKLAS
ncbi:MAG: hypothetical protein ACI9OJ_004000 [Myxococcota bacterium]|jgi:hypothetical protein